MRIHQQTVYLATDNDGEQFIFQSKPKRGAIIWLAKDMFDQRFSIGEGKFNHTWNDEPKKIILSLKDQ